MSDQSLKERLYTIIFEADTPAGKLFDVLLFVAIMASVVLTMLSSVSEIRAAHGVWLFPLNALFTGLFTVEYALRLYCTRKPLRYARSFFGVVDLLAILPFYIGIFIPGTRFLDVVKVLRMLRIFRVLKMAQYVGEADLLKNALVSSRRKIGIFLVVVMTIVVIIGSLMYVIEGEANGFSSIPQSVYWAIVTLTTVGYGDVSPHTPLGQTLAACIMIIGYSIIAVPSGIITAELGLSAAQHKNGRKCGACGHAEHDIDAKFCKSCGEKL
ncbi:ion transporter [Pontiella sulfatireligans]|uniref:Cyclic nucleotide-gated potassium channel n=1 Tax=Pontiella sulfatireligans TaxID=2750658 RepID=A0A6C2UFV1_9BACT|nr:ion transporter [Pontiella sulfatireligans]VGO19035.1 Cyclic nucleotide-gated potassium channel [Pontiella sulfatireligans]